MRTVSFIVYLPEKSDHQAYHTGTGSLVVTRWRSLDPMRAAATFAGLSLAATSAVAEPARLQQIAIEANAPTVTMAPRPDGRAAFQLPDLTYELSLTARCETNWLPVSIWISIADSGSKIDAKQLQDNGLHKLELQVPSNQIAPIRVDRFCIDDGRDAPADEESISTTISAAMSAQASLRCASESDQVTTYVVQPLDVTLVCRIDDVE